MDDISYWRSLLIEAKKHRKIFLLIALISMILTIIFFVCFINTFSFTIFNKEGFEIFSWSLLINLIIMFFLLLYLYNIQKDIIECKAHIDIDKEKKEPKTII